MASQSRLSRNVREVGLHLHLVEIITTLYNQQGNMKSNQINKVNQRVEELFAVAVAMEQTGRLKSTIFADGSEIFILGSDRTVLVRFGLRATELPFKHPVSFNANDYNSNRFYEEDGKIVFVTEQDGFKRTKSCGNPSMTLETVRGVWEKFPAVETNCIQLNKAVLNLMDADLSHVEISGVNGQLHIVQRNIYSGAVIDITRAADEGGLGLGTTDAIQDFGPVGIRTGDFMALFSFVDNVVFFFATPDVQANYCWFQSGDAKLDMCGFIAHCLYDELSKVTESEHQ